MEGASFPPLWLRRTKLTKVTHQPSAPIWGQMNACKERGLASIHLPRLDATGQEFSKNNSRIDECCEDAGGNEWRAWGLINWVHLHILPPWTLTENTGKSPKKESVVAHSWRLWNGNQEEEWNLPPPLLTYLPYKIKALICGERLSNLTFTGHRLIPFATKAGELKRPHTQDPMMWHILSGLKKQLNISWIMRARFLNSQCGRKKLQIRKIIRGKSSEVSVRTQGF